MFLVRSVNFAVVQLQESHVSRFAILTFLVLSLFSGCRDTDSVPSPTNSLIETAHAHRLNAKESFSVSWPTSPNWKQALDGPLAGIEGSYSRAVVDEENVVTMSIMVLPDLPSSPTVEAMSDEWEKGFLKKATRKISSKMIRLSGRDAYKVTGAIDIDDDIFITMMGILVVANGRNYTIGATGLDIETAEVAAFIDSFRIVEP